MKKYSRSTGFKQGIYRCNNPEKYKGSYPIVYRSGLELKSMRWLDFNKNVLTWGSESVVIPYQGVDGKLHRYFVDLVCEMVRKDGNREKYLIEVKPESQTTPPIDTGRKSAKTLLYESYRYATNRAKWAAATKWAESKSMKFIILTDKHLNI